MPRVPLLQPVPAGWHAQASRRGHGVLNLADPGISRSEIQTNRAPHCDVEL